MAAHLDTQIQYLKGVGPGLGRLFEKRGVKTVGELLDWYPRAYEDRCRVKGIRELVPDKLVVFRGVVAGLKSIPLGKTQRRIWDLAIRDSSGTIHCKFFRTPFRGYFDRFQVGTAVEVVGKPIRYRGSLELHHPELQIIQNDEEEIIPEGLFPIYTETEGLSQKRLIKIMDTALGSVQAVIPDHLPPWLREKYELLPREQAIRRIHQPRPEEFSLLEKFRSPAHRRIIFEEFFWLELFLAARHSGFKQQQTLPIQGSSTKLKKLREGLPFQLTGAQGRVLEEILADLSRPHPMHRLVQGDVGSGKTAVALLASAFAAENGFQVTIMVPTEILAEQHFESARKLLEPLGVTVSLLTSGMSTSARATTLESLAAGHTQVCVGTHALLQSDVNFQRLGLVIIDEQHRFGVHQRKDLKQKALAPHLLVMTATPIPRTLAMTVYGDLDVSVIDELPKGRVPIVTRVTYLSKRNAVLDFVDQQIVKGRQAYIIYPLVEESEKIDLKNAVEEYEKLVVERPTWRIGLIHGRLKSEEKDSLMRKYRDRELDVLVSTTVIEVGVDVPNANIMVIEHAERFGLSQLHQLRGRVGRGSYKSYCVLVLGHALSEVARERARIMESTQDGFKVAEEDLQLRGPGELLGSKQSGLPGFRLANLVRDVDLLMLAREAAFEVVARDPQLRLSEHRGLRQELLRAHGPTALVSVG